MSAAPPFARGPRLARLASLAVLLGLGALACESASGPTGPLERERERLVQARAQWRAQRLADYRFTFQRTCFCIPVGPVAVTVRAGAVVSAERVADGAPEDPALYLTIEGIFALLLEAIEEGAQQVSVEYDPAMGYPTSAYIDRSFQIADEELGLAVSDLRPLR